MTSSGEKVVARVSANALDDIPMGIVRVTTSQEIRYMNLAARRDLGSRVAVGMNLSDIDMDPGSRRRLEVNLSERFKGQRGSSYEVTLVNPKFGTRTLVQVTGVPEYGADGSVIGSIAFLRNRTLESANLGTHRAIEESSTWRELLERVSVEIQNVISFDSLLVTMVSENRRHLRMLFESKPDKDTSPIRWWPMPAFVKASLAELTETSAISVTEMFSEERYREMLENDPNVKTWLDRGFLHLLRRPVFHNGVLVAIVTLQRKDAEPFNDFDVNAFNQLPVAEAINIALSLDKKGEMQFGLDLIRDLGHFANDAEQLRTHLVDRLRKNYSWEHVSLFHVDEDRKQLRLVCQSAGGTEQELAADYAQSYRLGLLGEVRRTAKAVVVGDVAKHPKYLPGIEGTRSEMCLPVPGSRLRWILNVESALKDAFADEEQRSVELLLGVVGFLLDRIETIELKAAIFDSVADGIILTSLEGVIEQVNPAGLRMLDATTEMIRGRDLAELLLPLGNARDTDNFGAKIIGAPRLPSIQVDLRTIGEDRVPILLSGATLPDQIGGKVYIASDLRFAKRAEQMQGLKRVFSRIAAEMRIPLSLACSFLAEVPAAKEDVVELAEKALAQLRRADLPLERILRLSMLDEPEVFNLSDVDVAVLLARVTAELPRSHAKDVDLHVGLPLRRAKAAYSELSFCVQSIVAFLLRQKAQADKLRIDVTQAGNRVAINFSLLSTNSNRPGETTLTVLDSNVREFVLAEDLIANLMKRMGGEFQQSGGQTNSQFQLSLSAQEIRHETVAAIGA